MLFENIEISASGVMPVNDVQRCIYRWLNIVQTGLY